MPPLGEKKSKQYYAWNNFKKTDTHDAVSCGDEVSKESLGLKGDAGDDQWREWVEGGTVRTIPYPDIPNTISPADHYKTQAALIAEGAYEEAANALSGVKEEE
jgi:hypothetical protein